MINKHFYTWNDIEKCSISIVNQMYKDNWRPDYIVGITRGGNSVEEAAVLWATAKQNGTDQDSSPETNNVTPAQNLVDKINQLIHTGVLLVGIDYNNNIVGSIAGQKNTDWWADEEHIGDLWYYVIPDARKSTIAKKLLINFIKIVKEAKMKLRLGHVCSGDVGRKDKFYERHGFQRAGTVYVEG